MPDVCVLLNEIKDEIRKLRDFFSPVQSPGVTYRNINGKVVGYRPYGGWEEKRGSGYDVTYEQTVSYSGSTLTLNLDFQYQTRLKRIEMLWDDGTSKDYEIRAFSDYNNSSMYSLIRTQTGNTETSDIIILDFVYPPASRIQLYFSNYTTGKTMKILTAIEEL